MKSNTLHANLLQNYLTMSDSTSPKKNSSFTLTEIIAVLALIIICVVSCKGIYYFIVSFLYFVEHKSMPTIPSLASNIFVVLVATLITSFFVAVAYAILRIILIDAARAFEYIKKLLGNHE